MNTASRFRCSHEKSFIAFSIIAVAFWALLISSLTYVRAYAVELGLQAGDTGAATSNVRYVAVIGADTWREGAEGQYETWREGSGAYHAPASDMTAVARIDYKNGVISILTIPRDTEYSSVKSRFPSARSLKCNQAFKYGFNGAVNKDESGAWINYDEAVHAGAMETCVMLKKVTGVQVSDYVVVDLYTLQDIVKKLGGLSVNIPVAIKDYRMYSNGLSYSVNNGATGDATLSSWEAMVASRARKPYHTTVHKYDSIEDYKGNYPQLLLKHYTPKYYYFSDDSVRQFLVRRMLASLVQAGLDRSEGAASFVWNQLVSNGLIWTNLNEGDVTAMADGLTRAKKAGRLVMYGASALTPSTEVLCHDNGAAQYLIPLDANNTNHGLNETWTAKTTTYAKKNVTQMNASVSQFKSGVAMSKGWGDEELITAVTPSSVTAGGVTYTLSGGKAVPVSVSDSDGVVVPSSILVNGTTFPVVGLCKNGMQASAKVTYRATSATSVVPVSVSGTSAALPAKVKLNGVTYSVTGLCKNGTAKAGKVTYRATSATSVALAKAPNKQSVAIPANVKLNGKSYKVTSTSAKAFTGKKIRTVSLGSNVVKIAPYTFKGSNVTKLVLKTTKLTNAKVKNSLKGSKVKIIKVSVAKAKKQATLKKYKKIFTKKNTGSTVKKLTVS